MAEVIMPKMSEAMTEGKVLGWRKHPGDTVARGEVIAEIETDKVNVEIEAESAGTLTEILVGEGGTAPVGAAIARIESGAAAQARAQAPAVAPVEGGAPAQAAAGDGDRIKASPIARRLAAEHGLDLSGIRGSGPGGRILERDLEPYLGGRDAGRERPAPPTAPGGAPAAPPGAAPGPAPAAAPGPASDVEEVALTPMRQAAARAVVASLRTIPHFYVSAEADMAAALDLRAQLKAADAQISINDVILKAAALALRRHPDLNAQFVEPDRLRRFRRVHLGIMVAVPGGLVAPVLRDADRLPLVALAQAARRLIERARARQLRAEELQGATFSVSNLGQFPVTQFAAIVHPPEAAILAVGRIQERARVRDGALAPRPVLTMTVAADHRITDGAGVAEFLATVQHLLEHPILLSMT